MKSAVLLLLLLVSILSGFLLLRERSATATSEENAVEKSTLEQSDLAVPSSQDSITKSKRKKNIEEQKVATFKAQNEREESAEVLTILFKKYSSSKVVNSAELLDDLLALELEPTRSMQETGSDGNFAIVRTKNALKGTRYFHAQFFTDENGKEYLQHLSFEMGPKEPFARVKDLAKSYLSGKVISEISKSDYQLWKMDNGYNVWVKTLSKEELQDDPFNAYNDSDVGTKRIVIEEEIHPDGDEHQH